MTAPHYGRQAGSRVVGTKGEYEVHVWRHPASSTIELNIEEHADVDVPQDVIAPLTAPQARELAAALITAAQELEDAEEAALKMKQAQEASEKLASRLRNAPQVGDMVLIAEDVSAIPRERRTADGGSARATIMAERFGGRYGGVEAVNYDGATMGGGEELRAYVAISGGENRWIHVEYLSPVVAK